MRTDFKTRVLKIVSKIRRGQVMTYGQVAKLAGNPKAARAVGMIMNKNFDRHIPCHRVIRSDGKAGGYNRGVKNKVSKLRSEGVEI